MPKFILILLAVVSTTFAATNGPCTGRSGICIDSGTCSTLGGTVYSGKCPSDPNSIKCCDNIPCRSDDGKSGKCVFSSQCSGTSVSGKCPGGNDFKCCLSSGGSIDGGSSENKFFGPCTGGGGACVNSEAVPCETSFVSGKCPGGSNVKCCVAGPRPSWYINQNEHKEPACYIGGKPKSVATSGCGIASITMAIEILTGKKLNPTDLFKEAYDKGLYTGNGMSHAAINYVGKNHGVSVSWTSDVDKVYTALANGKCVIFNVGHENRYHFTSEGHYIFLKGAKTENNIKKVYVFDPNGRNNYINVLFALKSQDGGIQIARRGFGDDFGIVSKA